MIVEFFYWMVMAPAMVLAAYLAFLGLKQ